MRIKLASVIVLLPAILSAQERVSVKGRVINEQGEAVEYVQIGIPKHQIGTISTADGLFEIEVPRDTLEFFHVSYQTASYPVTGASDDVVIVLHEQELQPSVFIGGNTKEKYLVRPGSNVLKNLGVISFALRSEHPLGRELGSVAHAKKPFLVKDIQLSIHSNHIPGCVASVNIYRIEDKNETFVNVLHKPIYFEIAVSNDPQHFDIQPEETILLDPGRYFVSFQIVGYDEKEFQSFLAKPEEERKYWEMTMDFRIYLKSSYLREAVLGKMEHFPVNIGISVKGLEFEDAQ
ncbi:MAG: carboxypeptidase-like regulatory domain-containing protein [Bacteroidales bacterium]|nr:carboxypeptidase-like regulatory domain-containing protein [Bacteroidales bacterium]